MLQAIKELGEFSLQKKGIKDLSNPWQLIVENPDVDKLVKIIFDTTNREDPKFIRVEIADFDSNNWKNYMYKRGSSRGVNYIPGGSITKIKTTYKIKFKKWLEKYSGENYLFENLYKVLEREEEKIKEELFEKLENLNSKFSGFLILGVQKNQRELQLSEVDVFRKQFMKIYTSKFKESVVENKVCFLCHDMKDVSNIGLPSDMRFYNTDKTGYISSGFDTDISWKNLPICFECYVKLEEGWKFVKSNLDFRFSGIRYYLIPKSFRNDLKTIANFKEKIIGRRKKIKENKLRFSELQTIVDKEDWLYELIIEQEDSLSMNLMFYQKVSSAFYINKLISGVLPSRYKRLYDVKRQVDKEEYFQNAINKKKNVTSHLEFHLGLLRNITRDINSYLELIDKVFKGKTISKNLLLNLIINHIQEQYREGYNYKKVALESYSLLSFLYYLNLIKFEDTQKMKNPNKKLEVFFNDHPLINTYPKRSLFLLGVLIKKIFNIQYQERESRPFKKQLKSFKLRQRDVQRLFTKAIDKLEQYDKNYYQQLEEWISFYLVNSSEDWDISSSDINYYLALGISLGNYVSDKLLKDKEANK